MATFNELATAYAKQQRADYEKSLGYLTNDAANVNQATINSINSRYDNLLTQINNKQADVNNTYADEAQQAYINKLLAGRQLDTSLAQLGINTSGMGIQAELSNETAYGRNLALLQKNRDEGLRDIANQAAQSEMERQGALNSQAASYAATLADINQQKQNMLLDYENKAYDKYINDLIYQKQQEQQAIENRLAERKLEEEIRQANMQNQQYYSSLYARSGGGDSSVNTGLSLVNGKYYVNTNYYSGYLDADQSAAVNRYGTFNNGYQPKGVVDNGKYMGTVSKTSLKPSDLGISTNSSGVNISKQTVWKTGSGASSKYWIWNGSTQQYERVK